MDQASITEKLQVIQNGINTEGNLISQIQAALEGKSSSGNTNLPYITGIVTVDTQSTFTIPELAGYNCVMLYLAPTITSYVITGSSPFPTGFYCHPSVGCLCIETYNPNGFIDTYTDQWTYDSITGTFTGGALFGDETAFIYVAYKEE